MENKLVDIEEKTRKAFDFLAIELGIDISSTREVVMLYRAIEYANPKNYYCEPAATEENVYNQIFLIRAMSYFKRKMINPMERDGMERINSIRNHEEYSVLSLKARHQNPFK